MPCRLLRVNIAVLTTFAAITVVLTSRISFAAPAQEKDSRQPSARASAGFTALPTGVPEKVPVHALPVEAGTAERDSSVTLTFLPPLLFDTHEYHSTQAVVADVNGDGKPDLVVQGAGSVSVLLGNGDGTFQPAVAYSAGGDGGAIAVADVNGDGKLDIIAANENCSSSGSSCAGVLLGNGDGTFQSVVPYDSGGFSAWDVAVADVNGDGKPDIVVAHMYDSSTEFNVPGAVGVLLGNGDGTFEPAVTYSPGGYLTSSIVVGDFNGDGKPDLVVANQCAQFCEFVNTEGSLAVLLGNGDGTFQPPVSYDPGALGTTFVMVADLNGDHKLDLVAANRGTSGVLLGNGDGTFQPAVIYEGGGGNRGTIADLNRDGKLDLVYGSGTAVFVLPGNGDGSFQPYQVLTTTGQTPLYSVTVGDVNEDGWTDIVLVDFDSFIDVYQIGDGLVGVLLNNTDSDLLPTNTLLFSSLNPSFTGQGVTLSATVNSTAGPVPDGGKVSFYFYGKPGVVGTASLSGGEASVVTSALPTGTSVLSAIYSGEDHFGSSMSPLLDQVVKTTTKSPTSTTLRSSLNPSIYGQKIIWTAVVSTSGSVPPTGQVRFTWGDHPIDPGRLNSSGIATLATSKMNADSYPLTAVYLGDANNLSSTSPVINQVVTEATSSTTLTSSPNPSASGEVVTFTATVTSPTVKPTGPVTFSVGKTVLGAAQLSSGKATFTTSTLAAGSTTITATYSGDSNIAASSASVTQTVQP